MTFNIGRKHWVVFAILLAMQVPGMVITAVRASPVADEWIRLGLFAVPKNGFGWFIGAEMVLSLCFVTALIIVSLWEAIRTATK